MADLVGEVGNNRYGVGDGADVAARLGKTGEVMVSEAHARYYEASSRAVLWSACTATSGVAPGTSLSTTAAFWLHNPIGSGKNLALVTASVGYISGTLGAGSIYLTSHAGVAIANPAGTPIIPRGGMLGVSATPAAAPLTTATVPTQVPLFPLWTFGAALATSVAFPAALSIPLEGMVVVPPGFGVGLHSVATGGTSPLVTFGMVWEEIPIT